MPCLLRAQRPKPAQAGPRGGGIGYAIMPNWIIGVDYLHYDLGRANVTAFGAVIDPASGFVFSAGSLTASQSVAGDIVRGVINYKL